MEVTVIDQYNEVHKMTYRHLEYPSLMELIINSYYSEIGECKGRGLCGTCIVEVVKGKLKSERLSGEMHILKVNGREHPKYRLACQLTLDIKLNNLIFREIE